MTWQTFKNNHLIHLILLLMLFSGFTVGLQALRIGWSEHTTYIFLVWNLFLAWIPLSISYLMYQLHLRNKLGTLGLFTLGATWLLFFPNAPYIVTDLIHYKVRPDMPWWFDQVLLFSFIINGLLVGFLSLYLNQHILKEQYNKIVAWLFIIGTSFLSGFGIYLGRFQRWNSWDILTNFQSLMLDIGDRIINPFAHPRTYGVTLLFGTFLLFGYCLFTTMLNNKLVSSTNKTQ